MPSADAMLFFIPDRVDHALLLQDRHYFLRLLLILLLLLIDIIDYFAIIFARFVCRLIPFSALPPSFSA